MEHSFLSHSDAAQRNKNSILHYIKSHQPLSRTDIWEGMPISRASVTQVIRQLTECGLVLEVGMGSSTGGRKPQYLTFNGAAKKFYAFHWMSRKLFLLDLAGHILCEQSVQLDRTIQPSTFVTVLSTGIQAIAAKNLCPSEEIIGLCLSLPGIIDYRSGNVIYAVELGWQNVPIGDSLREALGMDVYVERIGNVMALGCNGLEHVQHATHFQLFILDNDGIGVSSVFHGNCQHGANYMHGELGHIKTGQDVLCSCGQRGCLEAVIHNRMVQSNGIITPEILEYLSIGIATTINISDSSHAVMVGSYVDQMTPLQQEHLTKAIRSKVTGQHLRHLDLHFSSHGKELAIDGMCAFIFDRYFAID